MGIRIFSKSAVQRDMERRERELDEIERLKAEFTAYAEKFALEHSGSPEDGEQGWRADIEAYIPNFLADLFHARERQIDADTEYDFLLVGGEV